MPKSRAKRTERVEHDEEILLGMARGPYANLWSEQENKKGRSYPGESYLDIAPATPRWAIRWGRKLADTIVKLNGTSLSDLYDAAVRDGYPLSREAFGLHLGMQAIGSGLRWTDDVRNNTFEIKVPDYEMWGSGCERSDPDLRFVK